MKRNSKGTKGWGFKFISILSSIMMVINTLTPVVPVFAEPEIAPSNDEVVDVSAENPAPAEENTPAEKPAEDADTANNNADKPATVETPKTAEDADKSDDSQIITEGADGNQDSDAKKDTSNGSAEKENNNTDQSLQNGENPETDNTTNDLTDTKPETSTNAEGGGRKTYRR